MINEFDTQLPTEEAEIAQMQDMIFNMQALNAHLRTQSNGPSLTHCEECGDEIPEARRLAVKACRHCISCKIELERMTN